MGMGHMANTATIISEMVDINLVDFTGRSGYQRIANNIDAVKENYNQDVKISVIRNGHTISTDTLLTGDKVIVYLTTTVALE